MCQQNIRHIPLLFFTSSSYRRRAQLLYGRKIKQNNSDMQEFCTISKHYHKNNLPSLTFCVYLQPKQ